MRVLVIFEVDDKHLEDGKDIWAKNLKKELTDIEKTSTTGLVPIRFDSSVVTSDDI